MTDAFNSAVSALNASASVAAVNAGNTANVNTPSFKSRMAVLSDMSRGGVRLSAVKMNKSDGYAVPTGNPGDIAVFGGKGSDVSSADYYGAAAKRFSIDDLGNLRSPSGSILFTGAGGNVRLDADGGLYFEGELIGRIDAVSGEYYIPTGASVLSGYVMGSNVDVGFETVSGMINLRYFQSNAFTVRAADEMLGSVIDLKA